MSAFLIAQFGKKYGFEGNLELSGNSSMDDVFEILGRVQRDIGGGIVYLECENQPKLLEFYQNIRTVLRFLESGILRWIG